MADWVVKSFGAGNDGKLDTVGTTQDMRFNLAATQRKALPDATFARYAQFRVAGEIRSQTRNCGRSHATSLP
jgi:hypothetical protein